jgi:hypothetical protein
MKTTSISSLEQEIRTIQQALQTLGPMHPGSISSQYQVCGRAGCRCVDPDKPERHGPYHKLSYVYRGKPACRFVRAGTETLLKERLVVYKRFRQLIDRWIALSIRRGTIEFFPATSQPATLKKSPRTKQSTRQSRS